MGFDFQKLSVLVVEDAEPVRELLSSVLATLGVGTIYIADDGEAGFRKFCVKNPDIVITDWHMEPMTGLDLVRNIRNHSDSPNKLVPVIMMSGYAAFPRVYKARDLGVTEYIVKPFTAADLARRIAYVINKPRDFIQTPEYFGPDRRRKQSGNYTGEKRRAEDGVGAEGDGAALI